MMKMHQHLISLVVLGLALGACGETTLPEHVMTFEGVGPVTLGMTVEDAQKALGKPLPHRAPENEPACWYTHDGKAAADWTVGYMVIENHIRRIDVRPAKDKMPEVKTLVGIGVGATHDEVLKAYGDKVKVELNKYIPHDTGNDLVVDAPQGPSRIIFETQKNADGIKAVTRFRVGLQPEVFYVEGCG